MTSLSDLLSRALQSVTAPREQLRWVLSHDLPRLSRWELLILLNLFSVLIGVLQHMAVYGDAVFLVVLDEAGAAQMVIMPYIGALLTICVAVVTVFLAFWAGRAFGGTGGFGDTILTFSWLQFILLGLVVLQVVVSLVLPGLLGLLHLAGMVLFFWLFSQFVAELHGFQSGLRVLLVTFGLMFVLAFVLVLLFGAMLPPELTA